MLPSTMAEQLPGKPGTPNQASPRGSKPRQQGGRKASPHIKSWASTFLAKEAARPHIGDEIRELLKSEGGPRARMSDALTYNTGYPLAAHTYRPGQPPRRLAAHANPASPAASACLARVALQGPVEAPSHRLAL